ncbi:MAG: hypothetical protein K2I68_01985, partial [Bacteroidales bacterium]|nr:hypothetical protein [Bacteroidales bacterium]
LGLCMPLTSCNDEAEPANDPASEAVPHHPTSNFGRCPLLAHIDNPKLGIKEITEEEYRDGELVKDSKKVYSYDKEQRLIKITGISDGRNYKEEYEYDTKGRPVNYLVTNDAGGMETHTFIYDEYGFLVRIKESYRYGEENEESEMVFSYSGDTLFLADIWEKDTSLSKVLYSDDLYPLYFGAVSGTEFIYEWKDGNLVEEKSKWGREDDWHIRKWEYDANVSIGHLTTYCQYMWFVENAVDLSKNNRIGSWSYTYDDKGLVVTQQSGDGWSYKYTYLYY